MVCRSQKFTDISLIHPADLSNGFQKKFQVQEEAADQDKNKKQLGDTAKLKGNSFYGKMIENLEKHISTKFTRDEKLIDKIFRSPFFERSGRNKTRASLK